jgi:epoxide hydrolase 4
VTLFSWTPSKGSGITQRFIEANGLRFELSECAANDGSTDRLALCLHGFPELNYSWRDQMPVLADKGWRVWAPNMRGYGKSSRPEGIRAYRLNNLTQDVAAIIDASGAKEVMLVAHDWGAIVAWQFAIQRIRPLTRLVIMNVPHPAVGRREIKHWRQITKSWYIFMFQLPWLPEWILGHKEGKQIRGIFKDSAVNKGRFTDEVLDVYARAASQHGALTAMINYYRALLRTADSRPVGRELIDVPTLMIWGEEDIALNIHCTQGTEEWVPNLTLRKLPGVSHWVQQDAPDQVNAALSAWLDT